MELTIYLAGGLFNIAELSHNARLADALRRLGRTVILPQERALQFIDEDGQLNTTSIAKDCYAYCEDETHIYVGSLDGVQTDDGTAVEYGLTIQATGRAIVYRTDVRTAPEKELGINAMFTLGRTTLIHVPCKSVTIPELDRFYTELAVAISNAVAEFE